MALAVQQIVEIADVVLPFHITVEMEHYTPEGTLILQIRHNRSTGQDYCEFFRYKGRGKKKRKEVVHYEIFWRKGDNGRKIHHIGPISKVIKPAVFNAVKEWEPIMALDDGWRPSEEFVRDVKKYADMFNQVMSCVGKK